MNVISKKINGLRGEIVIPPDKSVSHRAALFSLLTQGTVEIENFSLGQDCLTSLDLIQKLGAEVERTCERSFKITAPKYLKAPSKPLYCGNSGTTTRLISGILAGQKFSSTLTGDESLSKRPMKRIITPLAQMGAKIKHSDFRLPLEFQGSDLDGIYYKSPLASAQVKSCVLLAGLFANGETSFEEPYISRDHTELMLQYLGADIIRNKTRVYIKKSNLVCRPLTVVGDISSAAFFIAAALITPNSDITIKNVGLNPTRTGIIDVLKQMGGEIEILNQHKISGEEVGDIRVKYSELKGTTVSGEIIPRLIDEIPVLALVATQANSETIIKDAQDLKNKETDRISATAKVLNEIGGDITPTDDGFIIRGKTELKGGVSVDSFKDHRIAMTEYVAGLISKENIEIKDFEWVNISFPEFEGMIERLKQ
ncbi:3-phosphoshikimate 1-carboxyvinyltransferase [bacterium]|nr:3-phosphoshikimate 1-carboxyvinyltransferase [bacterium]